MARIRNENGRLLPAIKSAYNDEFADPSEREMWPTPRAGADNRAVSRFEDIEGRLYVQEKTTKSLIDRAYKIKEDIIDNLNITQQTWQEEKKHRELLQEHIRTITDVVRKLNRDIATVESEIKQKDNAIGGTQDNVKNLEMHHVAGLTDVRGRVARCDASIARLSADVRGCFESVKNVGEQNQENYSKIMERLGHLDSKINDVYSKLDKNYSQNELNLQHLQSDTGQKMSGLDSKTRAWLEDVRNNVNTVKVLEGSEREKLEARLLNYIDKSISARDIHMEKLEKETQDQIVQLSKHLSRLDEAFGKEREKNSHALQVIESKMNVAFENYSRKQKSDIDRVKKEIREGFSTVHESITNMKQVMDGKRKLLEEQLRKELGQIRKMVVLI